MNKDYPVGAAQWKVLEALGLTAKGFSEANAIFEKLGISVSSKRVGRSSEPVVSLAASVSGGFNAYGEGETHTTTFTAIDLTPVFQWMSAGEQAQAQRRIAATPSTSMAQSAPTGDALSKAVQAERQARDDTRRADEAQLKAVRQERAHQRARLFAAGYHWRNLGNSDDGDAWTLYAATGEAVTVTEALAVIDAQERKQ